MELFAKDFQFWRSEEGGLSALREQVSGVLQVPEGLDHTKILTYIYRGICEWIRRGQLVYSRSSAEYRICSLGSHELSLG